jgi:hypothetical protein
MKASFRSTLSTAVSRNLAFAAATALNATARNAAEAIRADIRRGVNLRKEGLTRYFVRGPAPRATRAKLTARVVVGAPATAANRDRGSIVLQHDEDGGTGSKQPRQGSRLMVPAQDLRRRMRREEKGSNPDSWRAIRRDLNAGKDALTVRRGRLMGMGKRRSTYAVLSRTGQLLVFERRGRGKRNTELLYFSKPGVRLRRRFGARRSARRVVDRELLRQFRVATAQALSTMRLGRSRVGLGRR